MNDDKDYTRAKSAMDNWIRMNHVKSQVIHEANLIGIDHGDHVYVVKNRQGWNGRHALEEWEETLKETAKHYGRAGIIVVKSNAA